MKTQWVEGVEVHSGCGNVFADLGLADAEKLNIKTGLVIEIRKAMKTGSNWTHAWRITKRCV